MQDLPARRVTIRVLVYILLVLGTVAGAAYAVGWYARTAYYVGFDAGRVAIFKGRPGGLLWIKPSIQERTAITEAAVPAAQRADLEAGKEEPTLRRRQQLRGEPVTGTRIRPGHHRHHDRHPAGHGRDHQHTLMIATPPVTGATTTTP